jgi:hypothetical protein
LLASRLAHLCCYGRATNQENRYENHCSG